MAVGGRSWWYVARALGERGHSTRGVRERRRRALTLLVGLLLTGATLAACGEDAERQDADEPEGDFPVEVDVARFPTQQRLADTQDLVLELTNAGDEEIPDLAVTIWTGDEKASGPFHVRTDQRDLADPNRPVWILEHGYPKCVSAAPGKAPPCIEPDLFDPKELDEVSSAGAETAATDTFAFGPLPAGESLRAIWRVTPVEPGTYSVHYEVAAGLHGKARAVTPDGGPVEGEFVVTISDKPPRARVTESGKVELDD